MNLFPEGTGEEGDENGEQYKELMERMEEPIEELRGPYRLTKEEELAMEEELMYFLGIPPSAYRS